MKRQFCVLEEKYPRTGQFRILEAYDTSDGRRTRVCSGLYKSLESAMGEVKAREEDKLIVEHGEDEAKR